MDFQAPTASETKVYYFLDDGATPYVSVIPAPPDVVTLGDFKKSHSFTNKGYKYYCKELDQDIGCEVKMELTSDLARLRKSKNGLYELFLLTASSGYGTLPRAGTLPRRERNAYGNEPPIELIQRRRRSLVELEIGQGGAPSSHPASSLGTVVSRRAGEAQAEMYTSNSEDPYRYDDSSRFSAASSSLYEPFRGGAKDKVRRRKPRKDQRYRKAYVPSTISSVTESSLSLPRIVEVYLPMRSAAYLGISVVSFEGSILVSDVSKDGEVGKNGRIEPGDQIVQVNTTSFETLTDAEAVRLLREVAAAKKPLTLFVAKQPRASDYDPLSTLASETLPLDISLWVQTAVQCSEKERNKKMCGVDELSQTFEDGTLGPSGETDDEEERALYDQRRNGIPRTIIEEAERRRENERNEVNERLFASMDPLLIVKAMIRPDSGLQVKNRKWLKILVPQSFIGRELVDWLLEKVEDLRDRKAARQLAAKLLDQRFIRHVVSKLTFTEKCYYVFGEAALGVRGAGAADSTNTSGGTLKAEATTEVTYVGSPAPPGMRVALRNHHLPNLLPDQIWPVSPITVYDQTRRAAAHRNDCESPVTNDYASMVGVESTVSYQIGIGRGMGSVMRAPPPNTPLSGNGSAHLGLAPPHPSPCETEFEDDDKRRMLRK